MKGKYSFHNKVFKTLQVMSQKGNDVEKVSDLLKSAKRIAVLTGAGISAESGVPTFRGGGGTAVWKGMRFDKISSAEMVRSDLPAVWEWFDYRRGVLRACEPNPAHFAIAEWQERFESLTLVTQNIDGLHRAAGSRDVIEVHGNIHRSRCVNCSKLFQMSRDDVPHDPDMCKVCKSPVRPDVVLFGEMLPEGAHEKGAEAAALCDIFFTIGTSALVYPAAALPEVAKRAGAFLVEINPEETPLSHLCDVSLKGPAGEIVSKL
ncbi:MAG: NAD-dependent deacylase [Acidobacteria bacterium]|nr:MAG: NAD-dependent deacylase [Acidobacteriota bacterium]